MNYATIKYCDIANGTGVRTSLLFPAAAATARNVLTPLPGILVMACPLIKPCAMKFWAALPRIILMGFPFWAANPLSRKTSVRWCRFLHEVRVLYPHKTIWCYTGNVYETELLQPSHARCEVTDEMLSLIDVLVDGDPSAQHDISLRFRGSGNQRIIDLNATRAAGHTVLWQDDPLFADHKM